MQMCRGMPREGQCSAARVKNEEKMKSGGERKQVLFYE